jgi:hypothetical protein
VQTDENLQKMLYPYLPEPMRNPETFKWMLSNPEYRQQLETMMEQQVGGSGTRVVSMSSVCTHPEHDGSAWLVTFAKDVSPLLLWWAAARQQPCNERPDQQLQL